MPTKLYLNTSELCATLGISRPTLQSWRQEGMPHIAHGSRIVRYDLQEVLAWLNTRQHARKAA